MSELKRRIGFTVPRQLKDEMMAQIVKDKYGHLEKSKWIAEAIEKLLKIPDFEDLAIYGGDMSALEIREHVRLPHHIKVNLDNAVISVRKKHPRLDSNQSCVVRTAIIQRLLRGK